MIGKYFASIRSLSVRNTLVLMLLGLLSVCSATSTQDATKTGSGAVTVTAAPPAPPTAMIMASPSTITVGSSTTLAMTFQGNGKIMVRRRTRL